MPFCATRCGYCDFNTYTPAELGGATPAGWLVAVRAELDLAGCRRLGSPPRWSTVFVGGGTPSLLGGDGPGRVLDAVRDAFVLRRGAEVTTEANPESTSPELFAHCGPPATPGCRSACSPWRRTCWRCWTGCTRRAGRSTRRARRRSAGFDHINLDLIYGTPGESDDDLRRSVDAAIGAGVDHVSGYALVVEDGTALARRVRRGEITPPDNDVLAQRYELLDARLSAAGFDWYEVSNWSRPGGECRHNIGYWNGGEWWGAGPGAHGFVGVTRWCNVKHPNTYAQSLAEGLLPVAGFEGSTPPTLHIEDVMLRLRLRDGLPLAVLSRRTGPSEAASARACVALVADRLVLTDRGRLLADAVVRRCSISANRRKLL